MSNNTIESSVLVEESEFKQICSIIDLHTAKALSRVNEEHLLTCWEVGEMVSAKLKAGNWGDKIVRELASYIHRHLPNHRGYGRSNLYGMAKFYETYSSNKFTEIVQSLTGQFAEIVQSLTGQMPSILNLVTYTHHTIILNRCDSIQEKLFYILYTHRENLNTRELDKCITNQTFQTLLKGEKDMSPNLIQQYPEAPFLFKDRLMLEALALPPKHSESKLHKEILTHMKDFILELGKEDFLFVKDEYPVNVGGDIFHIDLLFYHRALHCHIGIELKAGKFHPKDLGQLEFYLEALDRERRKDGEGPSIGILLCKDANQMVVEYALSRSMSPVMVAQYKKALIPIEVLQKAFDEYINYNSPLKLK